MIAINSDGSLVPCNQFAGYAEKHGWDLGNVKRDALQPVLQDSTYLKAVTCPISTVFGKNEMCAAYSYQKLCEGGCRAIATAFTDGYLGRGASISKKVICGKLTRSLPAWRRRAASNTAIPMM